MFSITPGSHIFQKLADYLTLTNIIPNVGQEFFLLTCFYYAADYWTDFTLSFTVLCHLLLLLVKKQIQGHSTFSQNGTTLDTAAVTVA